MRSRRVISVLLALVLGLFGGGVVVGAGTAYAAVQCSVDYTKNDWGAGFTASITLHNLGDQIDGWTLTYSYSGNQTLSQGWSGIWSQAGKTVTVKDAGWNGTLATGASIQIGANFSYTGTNTDPVAFAINGTACGGAAAVPQVSITSPADGATVAAGSALAIAATAAEPGGSIVKVEFYDGSTLLGADTTSPYSYTWPSVPSGEHTLTAKAYDASDASATSAAVHISTGTSGGEKPPKLHVSGNQLVDSTGATVRLRGVEPLRRRVHVRPGPRLLGRPGRRRLDQRDGLVEGQRGARSR